MCPNAKENRPFNNYLTGYEIELPAGVVNIFFARAISPRRQWWARTVKNSSAIKFIWSVKISCCNSWDRVIKIILKVA